MVNKRRDGAVEESKEPLLVVGIGASAGGLEALQRLFDAMPADTGMAFVVIQHLSPDFQSMMDELLKRHTQMPIRAVKDTEPIERNTIYLLTPGKQMVASRGQLRCFDRPAGPGVNMPINIFFHSLAAHYEERSAAIVLSGTGSDGSQGILDVHRSGGQVLVQSAETARFDGMPKSALATGKAHAVLAPEEMPAALLSGLAGHTLEDHGSTAETVFEETPALASILDRLKVVYGLDFSQYKRGTITRRILRRMTLARRDNVEEYTDVVLSDPGELDNLYCDLLIGVTGFFRDPQAYERLQAQIAPQLFRDAGPATEIRVWVAGCATGEEAYSVAMVLLECADKLGVVPRLKIFATDVHRLSIEYASNGWYPASSVEPLPKERIERFFTREGEGYRVSAQLRNMVLFTQHNVLRDPPFARMSLVTCRNVMIYFQPAAQHRALMAFQFALRIGGFLFLGPSEGLGDLEGEFHAIDRYWKIYRKDRDLPVSQEIGYLGLPALVRPRPTTAADPRLARAYEMVLQRYVPSGFLLNESNEIVHVFGDANRYLLPSPGRMRTDILALTRGDVRMALSSALHGAQKKRERIHFRGVRIQGDDEELRVGIAVEPLPDRTTGTSYYLVLFEETRAEAQACAPAADEFPGQSQERVLVLERELQYTRESLQSTVEELESSNEELQASNQELIAANEELQSVNEELHSVNEELYSVNSEYQQKILELNQVTSDLENLMQSTDIGTIFLDRDGHIRLFTQAASKIFNLIDRDIGRDIRNIRARIRDDEIFGAIDAALRSGATSERTIEGSGNCHFQRKVFPYRTREGEIAGAVLTLVDITRALEAEKRSDAIFESTGVAMAHLSLDGRWLRVNQALCDLLGYSAEELQAMNILDVIPPECRGEWLYPEGGFAPHAFGDFRAKRSFRHKRGFLVWVLFQSPLVRTADGQEDYRICTITDITTLVESEQRRMMGEFSLSRASYAIGWTSEDGKMMKANTAFRNLFGYSEDALRTVTLTDLIPQSGQASWAQFWEPFRNGERRSIVTLGLRHDGSTFPMEVEVNPFTFEGKSYCILFVRDAMTLETQCGNAAPCGFYSINPDGILVQVNASGAAWTGYSRMELLGQKFSNILTERSQAELESALLNTGEVGGKELTLEIVRKDGRAVPALWRAAAARDSQGHPVATHGTVCASGHEERDLPSAIDAGLPLPLLWFSADLERVLHANMAACKLLGKALEELLATAPLKLFPGFSAKRFRGLVERAVEGGTGKAKLKQTVGDGSKGIQMQLRAMPWRGTTAVVALLEERGERASSAAAGS